MKAFLKWFYGYRNRGDELLLFGVIDYISTHRPELTTLDIEVQDTTWMRQRYNTTLQSFPILARQELTINFVPLSKHLKDNFVYDRYFFGGGEVFAESRGFYGGRNYLIRYFFAINHRPFVLLGGIETPHSRQQQLLYRYLLPKAESIVCRDTTSYELANNYTHRIDLYHDFAIPVVQYCQKEGFQSSIVTSPYLLVNMIDSMCTPEHCATLSKFLQQYSSSHIFVYVSCASWDYKGWKRLQNNYPDRSILYDWTEHSLSETLWLFAQTIAGIGCRLHFLLVLQILQKDRFVFPYAEKVTKLITSTLS